MIFEIPEHFLQCLGSRFETLHSSQWYISWIDKEKNDDFVIVQEIKLNLEISELNLVTENNTSIDAS